MLLSPVFANLPQDAVALNLERFLIVLAVSLGVATLSRFVGWLRQTPYTLLLVIVGLGLALLNVRLINLSPDLILLIFLPPLLFEAGWNVNWSNFKKDLVPICLYAVLGVLISIMGITVGLKEFAEVSLGTALLIAASLSTTDPISVIALFRELGVDKRLTVLMEGESLFNDGVAVVAFGLLSGFAINGAEFTIQVAIARFLVTAGIGFGVGLLIGFGISYLTQRFDLPLVEQSLTLVAAYGAYAIAEELGGSGVIAVVLVGVILGNYGSQVGMSPRTRLVVSEFWEFLAFLVNSIVFLLIGDQVQFEAMGGNLAPVGITIAAVIASRAISTYGLTSLSNAIAGSDISWKYQTVLWWGGLRGSVSIALALSVPKAFPDRDLIIATVFGVILFTLLVQGLTTQPLLKKLDMLGDQPLRQKYLEAIARRVALNRVLSYLNQQCDRLEIEPTLCLSQASQIKLQLETVQQEILDMQEQNPELKDLEAEQLRTEALAIEADTYAEFIRTGRLNGKLSPVVQQILLEAEGREEVKGT
ncbi:MAG: sodium:proton antiporter [Synechococcales cyanobacterium T60_A2020_003]|nr:sodium:proton antiporter [Synechococcales cyanobacterium T60_A2020_003]